MTLGHAASDGRRAPLRIAVAATVAVATGILAAPASVALSGSPAMGAVIAALLGVLAGGAAWRSRLLALDPDAAPLTLRLVSGVAAVAALIALGRLAVFMVVPTAAGFSLVPGSAWEVGHSCVSAYFVAGHSVDHGHDPYADSLFTAPDDDPTRLRKALTLGPFKIDVYEYPPTFLLLTRALGWLGEDFVRHRMLWFSLNGMVVLGALLLVAASMGPTAGTRALLLIPVFWASIPTLGTLQKGNVQTLIVAISVAAMVLLERRRHAAGGLLLAFATLSKLYPGMLGILLMARGRWRAMTWTVGAAMLLLALTLIDIGMGPFLAFREHLPGVLSGEAFPAFRNPMAIAQNLSIPGLVFKLKLFGVPGMSFAVSKLVGWLYTAVVLAVIVTVARRVPRGGDTPVLWLGILTLATLRSPFLPTAYGTIPPLWLLTLMVAARPFTHASLAVLVSGWLALNVYRPNDWAMDPRLLAMINLVPQAVTVGLVVAALRSVTRVADRESLATNATLPRDPRGILAPATT